MPSGRIHSAATVAISGTLAGVAFSQVGAEAAVAVGVGGLYALLVGPDLDVDNGNVSDAILRRDIGRIFSVPWRIFWEPYAYAIKHRSILSHGPIIGTLLRIVYMLFPLSCNVFSEQDHFKRGVWLSSWLSQFVAILTIWPLLYAMYRLATLHSEINYWPLIGLFLLAVILSDTLHFIMDGIL